MFSFQIKLKSGRVVHLELPTQESAGALIEVLADGDAEYTVRGTPEADAILRKLTRRKRKGSVRSWFDRVD